MLWPNFPGLYKIGAGKMERLKTVLANCLSQMGRLEDIKLGGTQHQPVSATAEDTARLLHSLNGEMRFNHKILILHIISLCLLYAVGIFLVFYFIDSPKAMGTIFGGSFLGIMVIVRRFYHIWREKTFIDLFLVLIEGLPPAEALKAVESIYWKRIH